MWFSRLIVLFLLLLASVSAALIKGGPFFFPDTSNYLRGPDFAVVYFLGKKFATSWTQERTLQGAEEPTSVSVHNISLNSPFNKAVLGGRSIYYGVLLYLGHLTSYFWLTVFGQALIFLYLSHTLLIACLRLSFRQFVWITLTTLIATPVSFFISFLMPDIFASFLILAMIILTGFWDVLKSRDRIIVAAIILYSALAHSSHLLLLVCLVLVFACVSIVTEQKIILAGSTPKSMIVLLALILAGFLGEVAFSYGTRYAIGAAPIQPPFLMARTIEDGPGYRFLQKNCATKSYVVCDYISRLPTGANQFLWSTDPKEGVFNVEDLATRRALSSEQFSFVMDVFRFDPIGLSTSMARNFIQQLLTVGIREFFPDQDEIQSYKGRLPDFYFNAMLHSNIIWHHSIYAAGSVWCSAVYILSTMCLVLTWVFWPFVQFKKKLSNFPKPQWLYVLTIAVAGIFFNAAICGTVSGVFERYQSRISWIPPFILLVMVANSWEALGSRMLTSLTRRRWILIGYHPVIQKCVVAKQD